MGTVDKDAIIEVIEQCTGLYYGIRSENGILTKNNRFNVVSKSRGFHIISVAPISTDELICIKQKLAGNYDVGMIVTPYQFSFKYTADSVDNVVGCQFEIMER